MLIGAACTVGYFGYSQYRERLQVHALTEEISVTDQLTVDRVRKVGRNGFKTLIDLRPDGEEPDQPTSEAMSRAAKTNGLRFSYVPVPHGEIPKNSVDALAQALETSPKPVLLYCRTGRRAARTWALVESRRPGGLDAAAIERAVHDAGQLADDLDKPISDGVAGRGQGKSP